MNRMLVRLGFVLFLLGLLTGIVVPALKIPRLGVSAHLIAAIGGLVLAVVGLIWGSLKISDRAKRVTAFLWIFGVYGNWVVTLLSGVLGGSHFMPIASGGALSTNVEDTLLSGSIIVISLASVAATVMVLIGLRGRSAEELNNL